MQFNKFEEYSRKALSTVYSEPETQFHNTLIPKVVEQFFVPLNLDKEACILDIGCGQGKFMDIVKEKGYNNVTGVTLSLEDLAACGEKRHTTLKCEMSDIWIKDSTVDLIWCRHCLEHSVYPLFTLYEFHRLLKDGGQVYVEVPAPDCDRKHEFNPNHYSVMGAQMWGALFQKAGFTITQANEQNLELFDNGVKATEKNYMFVIEKHDTTAQNWTQASD